MKNKRVQADFISNPALEFSAALFILANASKNTALSAETGTPPDEKLFEIGRFAEGKCSSFLQKEIHFFMDQDKWSLPHISPINGLPFRFALQAPAVRSVNDLIHRIETAGEARFLSILAVEAFGGATAAKKGLTRDSFLERINTLPPEDDALKSKLAECLESPVETLHRLGFAMRQFYETVYRHFEDGILAETEPFRKRYRELFEKDPEGFLADYFKTGVDDIKDNLQVHVSFFMQAGILSFWGDDPAPDCFVMGIHSEKRFGARFMRARLLNFYKLLADEKRLELFELLSERPWYVNELAERLGLAASTVSHHLGFFIRSGLVRLCREEHRQYYSLEAEKVEELLERSVRLFLKGGIKNGQQV